MMRKEYIYIYVRVYSIASFKLPRERETQFPVSTGFGLIKSLVQLDAEAERHAHAEEKEVHYLSASVGSIVK